MRLRDDAAVKELHYVEGGIDDGVVFAEAVDAGDGDVGVFQGAQDAVFALDFVGGFGDEFPRGLFAEDVFGGIGGRGGDLVGWVGLAESELCVLFF